MAQDTSAVAREAKAVSTTFGSSVAPLGKTEERLGALLTQLRQDEPEKTPGRQAHRAPRDIARMLHGYVFGDILALTMGFVFAWTIAAVINTVFFGRNNLNTILTGVSADDVTRITQFFILAGGVILRFERTGHYRMRMPFWMEIRKIVETLAFALLINGFLQFASKQELSRLWLMSSWLFAGIFIIVLRSVWRINLQNRGLWRMPTLLVGTGPTADEARIALQSETDLGYDVVAQIDDLQYDFEKANYSWTNLCANYGADYVVIALEGQELMRAKQPMGQLMREPIPFSVSPPLHYLPVLDMTPQHFFNHDVTLLTRSNGLDQPLSRFMKRSFDIVMSSIALVMLSPILLTVAVLVKMDGGDALFSHKRLGMNGKPFRCLKFRSMIVNSEAALKRYLEANPEAQAEWKSSRKLRRDPRVTRLGTFLRKSSIDELPQLINVLRGDMSIVGPRPIVVAETEKYNNDIMDYYRVRPGLTGVWQVSGRSNVSYAQRVRMDSWYVRNWSLWHDVMIICKTFPALLKRNGAY